MTTATQPEVKKSKRTQAKEPKERVKLTEEQAIAQLRERADKREARLAKRREQQAERWPRNFARAQKALERLHKAGNDEQRKVLAPMLERLKALES